MAPRGGEPARREGREPSGPVWVDLPDNVPALGLEGALGGKARVRRGGGAPGPGRPALVVSWAGNPREAAEGVERSRAGAPGVPVVVFGPSAELAVARAAVRAGARGFVHARMGPGQAARALSVALGGEVVLPRELAGELLEELAAGGRPPDLSDLSALSPRQAETLGLVAEGLPNAEVARRLSLSESTVRQHLRAAYRALGVENRIQAARLVRRRDPREDGVRAGTP